MTKLGLLLVLAVIVVLIKVIDKEIYKWENREIEMFYQ